MTWRSTPPGRVFTPDRVANALWEVAVEAMADGEIRRVLDPAAGDGALLRPAARWIQKQGRQASAVGIELHPNEAGRRGESGGYRILRGDALSLYSDATCATPLGADYGAPPPRDAFAAEPWLLEEETVDVVVMNPPYLGETGNKELFRGIRCWNDGAYSAWYRKDCDLHHFFFAVACRLLRPGGVLVALTPAYYLGATSARPVREVLLRDGTLLGLWRAQGESVFPGYDVEAAVTVWRKGGQTDHVVAVDRVDELAGALASGASTPGLRAVVQPDEPWRIEADDALTARLDWLERWSVALGDVFEIVEGVSTGANRLRAPDADLVPDASSGDGILLLRRPELDALALSDEAMRRFVRRRYRTTSDGDGEWMIVVSDGDLPSLDDREWAAQTSIFAPSFPALEKHLLRFRPVLEKRAEIRRNRRRSWYACLWPRSALSGRPALVTPKWSKEVRFALLPPDQRPMTDHRVLIPRADVGKEVLAGLLAWLNGPEVAAWASRRLKRKGEMIEFYGELLAKLPVPPDAFSGWPLPVVNVKR